MNWRTNYCRALQQRLYWTLSSKQAVACLVLLVALCYLLMRPTQLFATGARSLDQQPVIAQEIHYRLPQAGEVFLIWGINGWAIAPEAFRPAGTVIRDNVMYTPMKLIDGSFVVQMHVPPRTTIDYVFQITKKNDGASIEVWDANGNPKKDYHTIVDQPGSVEILAALEVTQQVLGETDKSTLPWRGLLLLALGFTLAFTSITAYSHISRSNLKIFEYLRSDIAKIVFFVIATRIVLLFIGYLAQASQIHQNQLYIPFESVYLKQELSSFGRADVVWYMDIARNGYEARPFSIDRQADWAFYPLWPMILRLSQYILSDMLLSGLIIANLLFLLAIVFLYKLLVIDFDRNIAISTSMLVVVFPFSYFCSRPGPESLFLLSVVGSLYCAKKNHWLIASLIGALATLSRLQGILLILPLLYIYYRQYRSSQVSKYKLLFLSIMPMSLFLFMLHLYKLTGNLFASFSIQKAWDNNTSYPFDSLIQFVASPNIVHYYGFDMSIIAFIFIFFSVILTIIMLRKGDIPRDYIIYTILSMLLIISRDTTAGSLRYMVPIFPLHLTISLMFHNRRILYDTILFVFVSLQLFYFLAFVQQYNWAAN